ncbi:hypothetical protein K227x_43520 [Rubripirellula lacrimiformis]|uniref:PDZ domain-containing protein n=1 Tax=Rubripirellula lacrimiformis TaxID=1930273 RepID=A0A517NFM8_9BACT|nr:PDZ domain-containing protein [Rubripirellula lacrimiformis]QDT05946.1 hypothetical protein K227x_43520 [Rubripirellula lacrimiformis]
MQNEPYGLPRFRLSLDRLALDRLPLNRLPLNRLPLNRFHRRRSGSGRSCSPSLIHPIAIMALVLCGTIAQADEPSDKPQVSDGRAEGTVAYWVTQLNSDQYLRRETACQKLAEAGPKAVDDLIAVMKSGELETVERASDVLTRIAMANLPSEDGGTWDKLNQLETETVGRAASRAQSAIEEIRKQRSAQARVELQAAGVFVGLDEFVIRAISQPRLMVQIDEKWQGDAKSLQWLSWLDGIENARIKGPAVRSDVLAQVTNVPELKSMAIVDGTVDDEVMEALLAMKPINVLEFRYVPLTDQQGDQITKIPVRVSLNLMGTGISSEKATAMQEATPGLQIDHRQGGFLGVTCQDSFDVCEISGVVAKSAAEEAGLIRGDIIVKVDDTEVTRFKDLQNAINRHVPGDAVKIMFRRAETVKTVSPILRKFQD